MPCFWVYALMLLLITKSYSWNALGHRIVAEIAYHHLTSITKKRCFKYNHAVNNYKALSFVNAAVWLDWMRKKTNSDLTYMHYIDLPFSNGVKGRTPNTLNAVSAIVDAMAVIRSSTADDYSKGFSLRVLLHVVADIHQPLHAITKYDLKHPRGDKGGNLVYLGVNPVASNLHAYWDRGGGFLINRSNTPKQLRIIALNLEKLWPCHPEDMQDDVLSWAHQSYKIAVLNAYQLNTGQIPSESYQNSVQLLTTQRLALAGCRLAALLNTAFAN